MATQTHMNIQKTSATKMCGGGRRIWGKWYSPTLWNLQMELKSPYLNSTGFYVQSHFAGVVPFIFKSPGTWVWMLTLQLSSWQSRGKLPNQSVLTFDLFFDCYYSSLSTTAGIQGVLRVKHLEGGTVLAHFKNYLFPKSVLR